MCTYSQIDKKKSTKEQFNNKLGYLCAKEVLPQKTIDRGQLFVRGVIDRGQLFVRGVIDRGQLFVRGVSPILRPLFFLSLSTS